MLTANEIREKFLQFFEKRGHTIVASASLLPENDASVLFNTAGMQPLVPYLLGEKHPAGTRLANAQKCVRTVDIDEIGDNTHATFFEMLGNWSLGDYFKREAIEWSYEFLTSKEEGLGLDPQRLYITVFEGDENAPCDEEAASVWRDIFERNAILGERVYFMSAKSNWWSAGENGPCGPDTEMFYDVTGELIHGMTKEEYVAADNRQAVVEIWNDVFMEYEKKDGKVIGRLAKKNVDTGSGLERVAMVVQDKQNIFETDIFTTIFATMEQFCFGKNHQQETLRDKRIIADHIRTAVFLAGDGVVPSNKDQGYILRRLIRRCVRLIDKHCLAKKKDFFRTLIDVIIVQYENAYPMLKMQSAVIKSILSDEWEKFEKALHKGNREALMRMQKGSISGKDAFELFTTYGFPFEITQEIARENGLTIETVEFEKEFQEHQVLSRTASAGKFKGGLADEGEMSVKYHTATHLLQQVLREVLGNHIVQKGSNITEERLRFDFSHPTKMTPEEVRRVEVLVNQKIVEALPVSYQDLPIKEAEQLGAIGLFGEKYGDTVRVYRVGDFSLEFCGGPHVQNTSELGHFSIVREEASSAGIRRIKAVLQ
jgi:alanyl-tRNA synthetase